MREKREYNRINISFPIEYRILPLSKYFYTVSKDLSLGGAKIITNTFVPKNKLVKVNLNLIDKLLRFNAKVVWCNKKRQSEEYFIGLEFERISETAKEEFSDFLK